MPWGPEHAIGPEMPTRAAPYPPVEWAAEVAPRSDAQLRCTTSLADDGAASGRVTEFVLEGFRDARFNGVYASTGLSAGTELEDDFANASGMHVFYSGSIDEWCLKESFEPACKSALAIASEWGAAMRPCPGECDWRAWSSGWEDVRVVLSAGADFSLAQARVAETEAAGEAEGAKSPEVVTVDWTTLSRDIVMRIMHDLGSNGGGAGRRSGTVRARQKNGSAMACVCTSWRDAAQERQRRPSTVVAGTLSSDTLRSYAMRSIASQPHRYG